MQNTSVFQSTQVTTGSTFGDEIKRLNSDQFGAQAIIDETEEFLDMTDLRTSKNVSVGENVTPKAINKARFNAQPSMMQHTADYDGFSQEDSEYKKQKLTEKRKKNKDRFNKNRIVELCYGQNGLIEFLDLLFTQFPQRSSVKAKFNYYFAIRKQLQGIETQIQNKLEENVDKPNFQEWYEKHRNLLVRQIPQRTAQI